MQDLDLLLVPSPQEVEHPLHVDQEDQEATKVNLQKDSVYSKQIVVCMLTKGYLQKGFETAAACKNLQMAQLRLRLKQDQWAQAAAYS